MKRSKSVRLAALGSISLALAACDGPKRTTLSETTHYESVDACTKANVPAGVCTDSFTSAAALHRKVAPTYRNLADCEADFDLNGCEFRLVDHKNVPKMAGFAVTTKREVTEGENKDPTHGGSGGSGGYSGGGGSGSGRGFWRGLFFGDAIDEPRYYSEPIYRNRDGQGGLRLTSLNQQMHEGKTFSKATSGRFRISSPESFASSAGKLTGAEPIRVSRGGFGSFGRSLSFHFGS